MGWRAQVPVRIVTFGLLAALVAACGGGEVWYWRTQRVTGPDGTKDWFAVECQEMFDCYKHCGRVCPDGYDIANSAEKELTTSTGSGSATRVGGTTIATGRGSSSTLHGGAMLIHCRSADQVTPAPAASDAPKAAAD
jgi:hypothetical protein